MVRNIFQAICVKFWAQTLAAYVSAANVFRAIVEIHSSDLASCQRVGYSSRTPVFLPARRSKRGICYGNVAGWLAGWESVCHTPILCQND